MSKIIAQLLNNLQNVQWTKWAKTGLLQNVGPLPQEQQNVQRSAPLVLNRPVYIEEMIYADMISFRAVEEFFLKSEISLSFI